MRRLFAVALAVGLTTGCAAVFNSSASPVSIKTNPDGAQCELLGRGGWTATVTSPATLSVPHSAAPVSVACVAPGHRRTTATLTADSSGWIWGNSALLMATGGAAMLGLVVDEALGADWTYKKDVNMDLDADRKRPVRARSRDGSQDLRLEAR